MVFKTKIQDILKLKLAEEITRFRNIKNFIVYQINVCR